MSAPTNLLGGLALDGVTIAATAGELSKLAGVTATPVVAEEVTFTETGAGTYTASVAMPATDLLAGESISFALAGGKAGAYIANSQVSPRYAAAARSIVGVVTSVGAGTLGRTRMTVVYSAPVAGDITAAVKT